MISTNLRKCIDLYGKFDEGTETTDAVSALLSAANILNGLGDDHHAMLAIINAENIIRNYIELVCISPNSDYYLYNQMDVVLLKYFSGGAKKLTEAEFNGQVEIV